MRVLLTSEARFERTPDGTIWGGAAYGRALWTRYLDVFSGAVVAARVRDVREPGPGSVQASAAGVQFCSLPAYAGLAGLVHALPALRRSVATALEETLAVIVRTPSPLAYLVSRAAADARRPFAAEIVGDPGQVFAPGAFRHPLRAPIRCLATAAQKHISKNAVAVLYVTKDVLQRRYPAEGRAFIASDVALDDAAFQARARRHWSPPALFVLVCVGALDQPYKGTAVLLRAVSALRQRGLAVKLRLVGGGRLIGQLRERCAALGIAADVEFLGQQDRAGVQRALDDADLFVLPSLTEGLPRALLEAMARGLPAIATDVGGIPELLPPDCLVPPRNAEGLASRIAHLMGDDGGRLRLGERNVSEARRYHDSVQATARRDFLQWVKTVSGAHREVPCA